MKGMNEIPNNVLEAAKKAILSDFSIEASDEEKTPEEKFVNQMNYMLRAPYHLGEDRKKYPSKLSVAEELVNGGVGSIWNVDRAQFLMDNGVITKVPIDLLNAEQMCDAGELYGIIFSYAIVLLYDQLTKKED